MSKNVPDPPEGYQAYEQPSFPPSSIPRVADVIGIIILVVIIYFYSSIPNIAAVTALVFGTAASVYLHESMHYIAQSKLLGYDPVYEWPTAVYTKCWVVCS